MEEKYGVKVSTLKTQGMIYLPTVMATLLFGIVFACMLLSANKKWALICVFGVAFVVAAVLLVRQATYVCLDVYDKYLVQKNMFGKRVISADDLRAIIWTFPGANPINPRGARINNTSAELIFKDGSKSLKIQDSFYVDLEKQISEFQRKNNLPADLEVKNKAHRYD